jgi:hypothetical protein
MPTSYFTTVANAVASSLATLPSAPATIVVRETDVVHPRDAMPIVIVTMGDEDEDPRLDVMGGPGPTGQGDIGKRYPIGITYYRNKLGNVDVDATQQAFVLAAQQLLGRAYPLASVQTVYEGQLFRRAAWEKQDFGKGAEVSRFAVVFCNAESRTGASGD